MFDQTVPILWPHIKKNLNFDLFPRLYRIQIRVYPTNAMQAHGIANGTRFWATIRIMFDEEHPTSFS